ncbi:MAG: hypothetical protein NVSMB52_12710 [Chloroflexota bacterium]
MNDDGLPPPPAQQPRPVSIPHEEGLPKGFTGENIRQILDDLYDPINPTGSAIQPWRDRIGDTTPGRAPGALAPGGPGALDPLHAHLEDLLAGSVEAALKAAFEYYNNPITSAVHDWQVAKITELQAAFKEKHSIDFNRMHSDLINVPILLQQLQASAVNPPDASNAHKILQDKYRTLQEANGVLSSIQNQLADPNTSPEDHTRLESQRDGLQKWLTDAQTRFNTDQTELNDWDRRLSQLSQLARRQAASSVLDRMAAGTDVAMGDPTRPQSMFFIQSLRSYLMGVRAGFDRALSQ